MGSADPGTRIFFKGYNGAHRGILLKERFTGGRKGAKGVASK